MGRRSIGPTHARGAALVLWAACAARPSPIAAVAALAVLSRRRSFTRALCCVSCPRSSSLSGAPPASLSMASRSSTCWVSPPPCFARKARSTRAWLLLRQVRRIIEARAWRSWRTHVDKRTCNSVLLLRALAHIGARAISRAWRSWEVGLAAAHRVKRITCDAMLRRHQRELHWGFSLVRSHACQRTLRRAAFRRLRRAHDVHARAHSDVTVMARCAVAEWVARSLDAAWRGWRRWCEMAEGARAVELARRWAAWKATAEASKRRTGLLLRSLRSLCNVELRRGLCSWVQRAAELTLLRRGVAHLRCRDHTSTSQRGETAFLVASGRDNPLSLTEGI